MRVIIKGNKLVTRTEPKTIYFDLLPKDFGNNLKHAIDFILSIYYTNKTTAQEQ